MRVSVIISAHNQGPYVGSAIRSVLDQTAPPFEVIVVDDGSTDNTPQACRQFCPAVTYVRQDRRGPSSARNTGIREMSGDVAMFLDGDDMLCPSWIGEAVRVLEGEQARGTKVGVVHADYILFDETGRYRRFMRAPHVTLERLLRDSLLSPSGALIPGGCLSDIGGFDERFSVCEDWDYWLRLSLAGYRFVHVDTPGFRVRDHPDSLSKDERHALCGRTLFLEAWRNGARLRDNQRTVLEEELVRTYLRLYRAASYQGSRDAATYLTRALDRRPATVWDPWFTVYAAVYASPFYRAGIPTAAVERCVRELHTWVLAYCQREGLGSRALARRLRASTFIARAANHALDRRYGSASMAVLASFMSDPTIVTHLATHVRDSVYEVIRARGHLLPDG